MLPLFVTLPLALKFTNPNPLARITFGYRGRFEKLIVVSLIGIEFFNFTKVEARIKPCQLTWKLSTLGASDYNNEKALFQSLFASVLWTLLLKNCYLWNKTLSFQTRHIYSQHRNISF